MFVKEETSSRVKLYKIKPHDGIRRPLILAGLYKESLSPNKGGSRAQGKGSRQQGTGRRTGEQQTAKTKERADGKNKGESVKSRGGYGVGSKSKSCYP